MIATPLIQKFGDDLLPRFETVFRTLAFTPDIRGLRQELEQSGDSGQTGLDQYLLILASLQKLGLFNCSILHLDCSIGFVPFCLSLSMASQVTTIGEEPSPRLLEAKEHYQLHHLEVIEQSVPAFLATNSGRRWDATLCLAQPDRQIDFERLGPLTNTVLYLAANPPITASGDVAEFSRIRSLGLISTGDRVPMVLWELLRDA